MWMSSMLLAMSYIVLRWMAADEHTTDVVIIIVFIFFHALGFGDYQANTQFGVDQLTDASTTELILYLGTYGPSHVANLLCDLPTYLHQFKVLPIRFTLSALAVPYL